MNDVESARLRSKTIVQRSKTFLSEKAAQSLISRHPFNHAVCLLSDSSTIENVEDNSCRFLYCLKNARLEALLDDQFLERYVRSSGNLTLISLRTPIDRCNTVSILPTGILLLTLDADTYEQLGLQARKCDIRLLKEHRFDIEIDLKADSFRPGKALYDRVQWCFRHRINPLDLAVFYSKNGECQEMEFPSDCSVSMLQNQNSFKSFNNLLIPDFKAFTELDSLPRDEEDTVLNDLLTWFGMASCGAEMALRSIETPSDEFQSTFSLPSLPFTPSSFSIHRVEGLVPTHLCHSYVQRARELVESGAAHWCGVLVSGWQDAPVSWLASADSKRTAFAHSAWVEREHDYLVVVLPDLSTITYQLLAPLDCLQ